MSAKARASRAAVPPVAGVTASLADVVATIGVIELVCAPRGLDVSVGTSVIHDPASPPQLDRNVVVFGVGAATRPPDAAEQLIASAGAAGAAAVVLKLESDDITTAALRSAAERSGVALLSMPGEMTWVQALTLFRTASASVMEADPSGSPFGDLFALANAVAAMVGGAVTIEDRHSRVLAYSHQAEGIDEPRRQTILGRRVPDEWLARLEEEGVFRRLWAGETVRYAGAGSELRPRLAVAVRAGETILGSIWVAEVDSALGPDAEEALREAARIAALHLVRHRAADDLARTMRGDVLRSILGGTGSVDALAYRLGVPARGTFAVLALEPSSGDEVIEALQRERVLDLIALYGEAFRQRSAAVQLGRTIYVLLPGPDLTRPERLVALARQMVDTARDTIGVTLHAGIGSIVGHMREVPHSRAEADLVLRAMAGEPEGPRIADFDTARSRVALLELRDFASDRPHIRSKHLELLARHDAEHGTTYVESLRAYLDALGDIPRAARETKVHPNTFRYRLRRLVELSGLDLTDPEERLLVELGLRLSTEPVDS